MGWLGSGVWSGADFFCLHVAGSSLLPPCWAGSRSASADVQPHCALAVGMLVLFASTLLRTSPEVIATRVLGALISFVKTSIACFAGMVQQFTRLRPPQNFRHAQEQDFPCFEACVVEY